MEWIGQILFSDQVSDKVVRKHGLSPEEIRRAIACGAHDDARWHDDPIYGPRLMVRGTVDQQQIIVYLRPIDSHDGLWECLTAWRL